MLKSHEKFHSANGKRQILVADDEMINREILGEILKNDYDVLFASDGQETLDMIRTHSSTLSLVLLDIMMPVLTGLDILKAMKADAMLSRIPVIVMTSEKDTEVESLRLGAIDFIPKPYPDINVIHARVLRTIELFEDRDIIQSTERDTLTGLYNREYFELAVSSFMKKDVMSSAAIVFVDIDDFKNVNDTLGHTVGDDVICWFAKRVLGTFRHTDVVARYGGDEFVVFVNGIGKEDLSKRLQQLCDGFRFPYRNGDLEYPVAGSIGAAMFPEDGRSYLELLSNADSALYEAKRQGKNRFVLYRPGLEASDTH